MKTIYNDFIESQELQSEALRSQALNGDLALMESLSITTSFHVINKRNGKIGYVQKNSAGLFFIVPSENFRSYPMEREFFEANFIAIDTNLIEEFTEDDESKFIVKGDSLYVAKNIDSNIINLKNTSTTSTIEKEKVVWLCPHVGIEKFN